MFGHVLQMEPKGPAQKALDFAIIGSTKYQEIHGCHCTNLLELLKAEIKQARLEGMYTERQPRNLQNIAKYK